METSVHVYNNRDQMEEEKQREKDKQKAQGHA
jgi:hypothetical protein